jgi:hypothetical protein
MTAGATILMFTYCGGVTLVTAYFFYRVMTIERKKEDTDSKSN